MENKEKTELTEEIQEQTQDPAETPETEETAQTPEVNPWEEKYNAERDAHLRVAAEFDNFRKRTVKEKEASYGNGKADAVAKMLPVYDNLERALQQETADAHIGVVLPLHHLVVLVGGDVVAPPVSRGFHHGLGGGIFQGCGVCPVNVFLQNDVFQFLQLGLADAGAQPAEEGNPARGKAEADKTAHGHRQNIRGGDTHNFQDFFGIFHKQSPHRIIPTARAGYALAVGFHMFFVRWGCSLPGSPPRRS